MSVTNENSLMLFYKSVGVRYIMVKAATSNYLFNGSYSFPQFNSHLVNIAHAHGILIFGYNRSYGGDIPGEIAISDYVFNQGADGFVWDAESEWESSQPWIGTNGPAKAWTLCSTVRSNWPNKFLAHAPFPIISYHSSFPYKEFGYWSDAVMPQIYPFGWTNVKSRPSGGINWTDVNWYNFQNGLVGKTTNIGGTTYYWTNAIKPLAFANHVYGPNPPNSGVSEIPAEYVMEFVDFLNADPVPQTVGGYKGANFWRADLHGAGQWANIQASTIGDFAGVVNNVVIDNPTATAVGSWTSTRTFYNGTFYGNGSGSDTNSFGTNYLTKAQGAGSAYVQFTPTIVVPGDYKVYQWHPYLANASASVPHVIAYNGGSTTVYANQQTNPGTWSLLGTFNFAAGSSGYIRVTDGIGESGAVAAVDGVKLVFVMPASVPAAPSGLSASAVSTNQIDLAWTDNATNESAYIVARSTTAGGPYTNLAVLPLGSTSFSNTGLTPATTYYYVVWATNYLGASATAPEASAATPGEATPPVISAQPQGQTVIAGQSATFTVTATGTALSYQWRFNSSPIAGATGSSFMTNNVQIGSAGSYSVVITNSVGATNSANAVLTVNFSLAATATVGGTVSKSPDQSSYAPNDVVTLTATADAGYEFAGWSGDATGTNNPLAVTLTANKTITAAFYIPATDIILDNTNPAVTFNGVWQTGVSSTDKYGLDYRFASTAVGGLSNVIYRPYISTPGYYDVFLYYPQGANRATNAPWSVIYDGGTTNVSVNQTANGGAWLLIAAARPFARGTDGYVSLSNDTGYSGKVVMADAVRFAYVGPINVAPAISQEPRSQNVNQGDSASFSVTASGTPAPAYQWRRNSADIAGATDSAYIRNNVLPADAGSYSVVVSNVAGTVTSADAVLTVNVPPGITGQPQSVTAAVGSNVTFTVTATGTLPLEYQWRFNGTNLAAATGSAYTRTDAQLADAGSYSVIVSNLAGMAVSDDAVLLVTQPAPPQITGISFVPEGQIRLEVSGAPGHYAVEATTNLAGWLELTNFTTTGDSFEYVDPDGNLPQRFYRVRLIQ